MLLGGQGRWRRGLGVETVVEIGSDDTQLVIFGDGDLTALINGEEPIAAFDFLGPTIRPRTSARAAARERIPPQQCAHARTAIPRLWKQQIEKRLDIECVDRAVAVHIRQIDVAVGKPACVFVRIEKRQ